MSKIKCYTSSMEDAARCITQLQNAAAASEFVVVSKPEDSRMLLDHGCLSAWAKDVLAEGKHLFGGNQINSYSVMSASYPVVNKIGAEFHVDYMATPKAVNDLRCTCAVIARDLLNGLGEAASFTDKLYALQQFFSRQFRYRDSGRSEAHSAVDLLRTGMGVCQAVASLATAILPFMGIPCLYISGEGYSGSDWGPHGWNVVRSPAGRWLFIDFTFGLNSVLFPPSTINGVARKCFLRNHRWDAERHTEAQFEKAQEQINRVNATCFSLRVNRNLFSMDGIQVSAGNPVLRKKEQDFSIDLVMLFRLIGGGVEYIPDRDRLHFVLYNRQSYIEHASKYINHDGTFDIRILNMLSGAYSFSEDGIVLQLGGSYE